MLLRCSVQFGHKDEIELSVDPDSTIEMIKTELQSIIFAPWFQQQLYLENENLENHRTVSEYGIECGTTVFLYLKSVMRIFVQLSGDEEIVLLVDPSHSIEVIKINIEKENGVPVLKQRLFVGARELEGDKTVSECGIKYGETVSLYFTSVIKLFVQLSGDEEIALLVDWYDCIKEIKEKIEAKKGVPVQEQRLFLGDKELENDNTVWKYHIRQEAVVLLYQTGHMWIFVYLPAGDNIALLADPPDSIKMIKAKIEKEKGVPVQEQRLFLGGKELENDRTVSECGIREGSTLKMLTLIIKIKSKSKLFHITAEPSETVADLKRRICEVRSMSFQGHRLLFKSKHLSSDDSTVEMCGIAQGSTLVLEKQVFLRIAAFDDTMSLSVWPSDTVRDVKYKIELKHNMKTTEHRFLFEGRHLSDECSLAELGDHESLLLKSERRCQLFVKDFSDEMRFVFVWPSDKVLAVKNTIAEEENRASSDFLLLHRRRVLDDDFQISNLKTSRTCPLLVVSRPRGFVVVVWDVDEDTAFCMQTEISATVREVKGKLNKEMGIPIDRQLLFHRDAHLEDNWLLADQGIDSTMTISLVRVRETGTTVAIRRMSHGCNEIYAAASTGTEVEMEAQIAARHEVAENDLDIIFVRKPIDEDLRLSDQGLGQDSVISVVENVFHEEIDVAVKPAGQASQVMRFTVASSNTILELKHMIERETGVSSRNQCLSFGDIDLKNADCISDYEIRDNAQMILVCKVHLYIKSLDSQEAHFYEKHTVTIEGLKASVAEKFGIPSIKQRLILFNKELRNDENLWQCALEPSRPVSLVIAERRLMWIFVCWSEKRLNLRVAPSDYTLDVKKMIYEQAGIPVEWQMLSYNERSLQDDATLAAMEVSENAVLYVHESRAINFVVKFLSGIKRISVSALESETIKEIKAQVRQRENIPSEQQKFYFNCQELADKSRLSECGIQNGSVINVVFQHTGVRQMDVKSVCGRTATISIKQIDRLGDVKKSICRATGLNKDSIKVSIDSTPWESNCPFWQMEIGEDATIFVTRKDRNEFWLFVACKGTFRGIVALPTDTFKDVSARMYQELDLQRGRAIFMLDHRSR